MSDLKDLKFKPEPKKICALCLNTGSLLRKSPNGPTAWEIVRCVCPASKKVRDCDFLGPVPDEDIAELKNKK